MDHLNQLVITPKLPLPSISLERIEAATAHLYTALPVDWLNDTFQNVTDEQLTQLRDVLEYVAALQGAAKCLLIDLGRAMADRMTVAQQARCLTLMGEAALQATRRQGDGPESASQGDPHELPTEHPTDDGSDPRDGSDQD